MNQMHRLALALILIIFMGGCATQAKDSISNLSFSHDGKKVVFDSCQDEYCQIQVYDLETGELAAYQSPKKERWTMGRYSYDGKRITFSVIPIKFTGRLDLGQMQIAVMDADGKNYRKVTTGPGAKLYPVFSHSGKKILYACAARIRKSGRTPAADYDAWEVDLTTGVHTQLTFFEYFYMSNLTYFPDDERFIYYGEHPSMFEGVRSTGDAIAFGKKMEKLAHKNMSIHDVVVMKGKELIPKMYDFGEKFYPKKPLLSKDGSRLIVEKDASGGKFYLYSLDGNHRLVGRGGSVDSAAISPNGELLAIMAVGITMDVFTIQDGKRKTIFYLPCAPKTITNWEDAYRGKESLYRMIPEKPSHILNQ